MCQMDPLRCLVWYGLLYNDQNDRTAVVYTKAERRARSLPEGRLSTKALQSMDKARLCSGFPLPFLGFPLPF